MIEMEIQNRVVKSPNDPVTEIERKNKQLENDLRYKITILGAKGIKVY